MRIFFFLTLTIFLTFTLAVPRSGGVLLQKPARSVESGGDCQNATSTAAMRACENARYEKADRELNVVYQKLIKELEAGPREKLRVAQNAWLRFRDANSDFQASLAEGGTMAPLLKISTLAEMTEARTEELRKAPMQ